MRRARVTKVRFLARGRGRKLGGTQGRGAGRRLGRRFYGVRRRKVRFVPFFSGRCPPKLTRVPSPPCTLFIGKAYPKTPGETTVIKTEKYDKCKRRCAERFTRTLTTTNISVVDNVTGKVSKAKRETTLGTKKGSCTILKDKISIYCPESRVNLCVSVVRRKNKVLSRFPPKAPPLTVGFPVEGQVVDNLSSTILIVRTQLEDNSLVATSVTLRRKGSICTLPKSLSDPLDTKYGRLVRRKTKVLLGPRGLLRR